MSDADPAANPNPTPNSPRTLACIALLCALAISIGLLVAGRLNRLPPVPPPRAQNSDALHRPPIRMAAGKVRPALPHRIVSFHWGRADKALVRLAHHLGFNGVMIQIEGSTVEGIKNFARYDAQEKLIDFCHALGMKVTLWVHEFSDLPGEWMPEWLGPVSAANPAVWSLLDQRYEWVLGQAVPNIDGLVLTVVETQVNATDTPVMLKLAGLLRDKCLKYGKSLIVRSFVWYPDEFASVMAAIRQLPPDALVMSKCVPQDWQMRGAFASEIGNVGGRPQIVEYDVAGEYFLRDHVANGMPRLLKKHFDYGLSKGVSGICVRVDRENSSILHQPSEVNLWALGMLAAGASDDLEEVWTAWATNRFSAAAAPAVIRALKPTEDVVAEMLSIGPFTFGDTRYFPPLADEEVFGDNWQNWRWDSSFEAAHQQAEAGEAAFTRQVQQAKRQAMKQADQCLADLELARPALDARDYAILRTKLLTNKAQLEFRAPMALATLHYRRMTSAATEQERTAAEADLRASLAELRQAVRPVHPPAEQITHLGRTWKVGPPAEIPREWAYYWAWQMDQLRQGQDPRAGKRASRGR